jgi:hypothetical protein
MLSVIMLSVIMLSVIMLSVIILSVIMLSVVIAECHYAECHYAECHGAFFLLSSLGALVSQSSNRSIYMFSALLTPLPPQAKLAPRTIVKNFFPSLATLQNKLGRLSLTSFFMSVNYNLTGAPSPGK